MTFPYLLSFVCIRSRNNRKCSSLHFLQPRWKCLWSQLRSWNTGILLLSGGVGGDPWITGLMGTGCQKTFGALHTGAPRSRFFLLGSWNGGSIWVRSDAVDDVWEPRSPRQEQRRAGRLLGDAVGRSLT